MPSCIDSEGNPVSQSNLRGLFGNNSVWYIPTSGPNAGEAFMFGYGPMECDMCGPFLTRDQDTLFLAAQHPGESNGTRMEMAAEARAYAMKTTDGDGLGTLSSEKSLLFLQRFHEPGSPSADTQTAWCQQMAGALARSGSHAGR